MTEETPYSNLKTRECGSENMKQTETLIDEKMKHYEILNENIEQNENIDENMEEHEIDNAKIVQPDIVKESGEENRAVNILKHEIVGRTMEKNEIYKIMKEPKIILHAKTKQHEIIDESIEVQYEINENLEQYGVDKNIEKPEIYKNIKNHGIIDAEMEQHEVVDKNMEQHEIEENIQQYAIDESMENHEILDETMKPNRKVDENIEHHNDMEYNYRIMNNENVEQRGILDENLVQCELVEENEEHHRIEDSVQDSINDDSSRSDGENEATMENFSEVQNDDGRDVNGPLNLSVDSAPQELPLLGIPGTPSPLYFQNWANIFPFANLGMLIGNFWSLREENAVGSFPNAHENLLGAQLFPVSNFQSSDPCETTDHGAVDVTTIHEPNTEFTDQERTYSFGARDYSVSSENRNLGVISIDSENLNFNGNKTKNLIENNLENSVYCNNTDSENSMNLYYSNFEENSEIYKNYKILENFNCREVLENSNTLIDSKNCVKPGVFEFSENNLNEGLISSTSSNNNTFYESNNSNFSIDSSISNNSSVEIIFENLDEKYSEFQKIDYDINRKSDSIKNFVNNINRNVNFQNFNRENNLLHNGSTFSNYSDLNLCKNGEFEILRGNTSDTQNDSNKNNEIGKNEAEKQSEAKNAKNLLKFRHMQRSDSYDNISDEVFYNPDQDDVNFKHLGTKNKRKNTENSTSLKKFQKSFMSCSKTNKNGYKSSSSSEWQSKLGCKSASTANIRQSKLTPYNDKLYFFRTRAKSECDTLEIFECDQCDFQSDNLHGFKKHLSLHSEERMFACELCAYRSKQLSGLKAHMVVHFDHRPFKCHICKYTSKRRQNLMQHLKTHSTEKTYACNICKYFSATKRSLDNHMRKHESKRKLAYNVKNGQNLIETQQNLTPFEQKFAQNQPISKKSSELFYQNSHCGDMVENWKHDILSQPIPHSKISKVSVTNKNKDFERTKKLRNKKAEFIENEVSSSHEILKIRFEDNFGLYNGDVEKYNRHIEQDFGFQKNLHNVFLETSIDSCVNRAVHVTRNENTSTEKKDTANSSESHHSINSNNENSDKVYDSMNLTDLTTTAELTASSTLNSTVSTLHSDASISSTSQKVDAKDLTQRISQFFSDLTIYQCPYCDFEGENIEYLKFHIVNHSIDEFKNFKRKKCQCNSGKNSYIGTLIKKRKNNSKKSAKCVPRKRCDSFVPFEITKPNISLNYSKSAENFQPELDYSQVNSKTFAKQKQQYFDGKIIELPKINSSWAGIEDFEPKILKRLLACERQNVDENDLNEQEKNKEIYKCNFCPQIFTKKSGLVIHERSHKMKKSFFCSKCTFGFYFEKAKLEHEKTCTKIFESTQNSYEKSKIITKNAEKNSNNSKTTGQRSPIFQKCFVCDKVVPLPNTHFGTFSKEFECSNCALKSSILIQEFESTIPTPISPLSEGEEV